MDPSEVMGHPPIIADKPRWRNGQVSTTVLLGGILALATTLRLLHLGDQSLWWDEGASVSYAQAPWREFLETLLHGQTNMSLYYILLRLWISLGSNEFSVRSLSVIFSVATVPVAYALAARMFDMRTGLIAALLLALNAFHIQYAQEARSYSLEVFLVSLSSLCFVIGIEQPSRRIWIAYIVSSVLAVYSHLFAVFVLAAHGVSLVFLRQRDVPWRALMASVFAIGLLILPFGILVVAGDRGQINWIPRPTPDAVFRVLVKLAGAVEGVPADQNKLLAFPEIGRRLLWLLYFALCTNALVGTGKLWILRRGSVEAWRRSLIVTWLFVPLALAFCISMLKPIFITYYLIICLPPTVLLAALGISGISRPWVRIAVLAGVVTLAGSTVSLYYQYTVKEDWRGMTHYILAHAQPGDAIVFYTGNQQLFKYYLERMTAPASQAPRVVEFSDAALQQNAAVWNRSGRIWLVLSHDAIPQRTANGAVSPDTGSELIRASLTRNHSLVHEETFYGIRVLLYSPQKSGSLKKHIGAWPRTLCGDTA